MMPVKVSTHVTGTLIFRSGALIQITLSFDVPKHAHVPDPALRHRGEHAGARPQPVRRDR